MMKKRIATEISSVKKTRSSTGVLLGSLLLLVGVGIGIVVLLRLRGTVLPSPVVVSGSTQTAVWEVNTPADFTYDTSTIAVTSTQAELQRVPNWWDTAYTVRAPLTITTGSTPAAAGQTVVATFSTAAYPPTGLMQADRDDLRVVYWNGSANQELSRDYLAHDDFRFKVQASIPANSSSSDYYMYFGNQAATAPTVDRSAVYEYYEPFDTDVFSGAAPWSVYCGAAGAPFSSSGGALRHIQSTPSDCFAYGPFVPDMTKDWTIESEIRLTSGTRPLVGSLHLHDSNDLPGSPNSDGYWLGLVENASDTVFVRNKAGTFAPTPAAATITTGTYYRLKWHYNYQNSASRVMNAWLDGTRVITDATDTGTNFASGRGAVGVQVYQNGATLADVYWESIKAWEDIGAVVSIPRTSYFEGQYPTTGQTLELKSGRGLRYGTLSGMSAVGTNAGDVRFILSSDDGATWFYLDQNTMTWLPSDGTYAQASPSTLISVMLPTRPFTTNGTLRWRALLASAQGVTPTTLDQVAVAFAPDPSDRDNDGYASASGGGNDCVDSLMSQYISGTPTCNATAPPTQINVTLPIADHAWVRDNNGTYHLFFQDNVEPWSIIHYTTEDFQTMTLVGTALTRGNGSQDFDRDGMWAPNIMRKDGVYYMFYSGVTGPGSNPTAEQRIGVATSTDLTTWTKLPSNRCTGTTGDGCIYDCQASWTAWSRGGQYDRQCRDPMVIFDPVEGNWKLFATARALSDSNQIVTVAYSSNFSQWYPAGYIEASRGSIAENPFVTQFNSRYYLFFTNYNSGGIKYATSPALTTDINGSANWVLQAALGETNMNAPEISVLNTDTWMLSESDYSVNPTSADLALKRIAWNEDGTLTLANLTRLACRVPSDAINPGAAEVIGDGIDNNCNSQVDESPLCVESWQCADWSSCQDNLQTRTCADANACGTTLNKPSESQACTPLACTENWSCTDWSSCSQGNQSRTCTDGNVCGTVLNKPAESQTCGQECTEQWRCTDWSACSDGKQTRTCTDEHTCGTVTAKPAIEKACQPDADSCVEDWRCSEWSSCINGARTRTCRDQNSCPTVLQKPTERESCGAGGGGVTSDLLIGAIPSIGSNPIVRLFTKDGKRVSQFSAYAKTFQGKGGTIAVGDIDGDGRSDILTGTSPGSVPLMRAFSQRGKLLHQFAVYGAKARTGITIAVGDLNGDGKNEVLTTPGGKGRATIDLFTFDPSRPWFTSIGKLNLKKVSTSGLSIATGDVDGNGVDELLVASTGKTVPRVSVYSYNATRKAFVLRKTFLAFSSRFRQGVFLAAGDVDGDGDDEIIASSGPGVRAELRVFDGKGFLTGRFFAAGSAYRGGAYPSTADIDGDGKSEILTSSNRSGAANVFVFQRTEKNRYIFLRAFPAFPASVKSGLRIDASH